MQWMGVHHDCNQTPKEGFFRLVLVRRQHFSLGGAYSVIVCARSVPSRGSGGMPLPGKCEISGPLRANLMQSGRCCTYLVHLG